LPEKPGSGTGHGFLLAGEAGLFPIKGARFIAPLCFPVPAGQHRKYLPYAFTEYGVLMLGNVLKFERAVELLISSYSRQNLLPVC
jgi:hypothetical protein